MIHHLQPKTLINNRIGEPGDYDTPEQFSPKAIPTRKGPRLGGTDLVDHSAGAGVPKPEDFRRSGVLIASTEVEIALPPYAVATADREA